MRRMLGFGISLAAALLLAPAAASAQDEGTVVTRDLLAQAQGGSCDPGGGPEACTLYLLQVSGDTASDYHVCLFVARGPSVDDFDSAVVTESGCAETPVTRVPFDRAAVTRARLWPLRITLTNEAAGTSRTVPVRASWWAGASELTRNDFDTTEPAGECTVHTVGTTLRRFPEAVIRVGCEEFRSVGGNSTILYYRDFTSTTTCA